MARRIPATITPVILIGCAHPTPAIAHGFGQRYDLPIPLSFYLWGAGAAVAFSFAIFALSVTDEWGAPPLPSRSLRIDGAAYAASVIVATILRALGCALFILVVLAGFFG